MLSFGLDAGFESFPPLVNGLVHNRLIQVRPDLNKLLLQFSQITNRFLIHALLHDFIINGIQVRTTRQPQVRWSEIWRFITQEFDCWSCSVGWRVVLLEDVRVSCQLTDTWKPCSWYSAHTKLFKHNESTTEWQCTVWKIILGELILINLCRPALGVQFFMKRSVVAECCWWNAFTVSQIYGLILRQDLIIYLICMHNYRDIPTLSIVVIIVNIGDAPFALKIPWCRIKGHVQVVQDFYSVPAGCLHYNYTLYLKKVPF